MKQKRLAEVRTLVEGESFTTWFSQLESARAALISAESHYEEALAQTTLMEFRAELAQKNAIDTLYKGGEHEDTAATMLAETTDLENKSFKGVSDFEEQRYRASEAWYRVGAAEKNLEEAKDLKRPAAEVAEFQRLHKQAADEYERENGRKARLWDEVERLWAQSAEVSLLVAEQRSLSARVRRRAENLFAVAEQRKQRAKELKEESEAQAAALEAARARVSALKEQAREKFGCAVGEDFLYFRHRDDQRAAWAVALLQDSDSFNIEVKPRAVYLIDRQKGVAFLEPARATPLNVVEADQRFEDYFLKGRKGESRARV
jgi:hypothetical protein